MRGIAKHTVERLAPPSPILTLGRALFGAATLASGLAQLVTGRFVRIVPDPTMWRPVPSVVAYGMGAVLVALGLGILSGRLVRTSATVFASLLAFDVACLYLPTMIRNPVVDTPFLRGFMYTNPLKCLALVGGCAIAAARWPDRIRGMVSGPGVGRLAPLAPEFLALFLVVGGIQHFWYARFVDTLVPTWIPPGQRFWTLFAGVALILGGVGILVPRTARLAGLLCGAMILSWVVLLHIPRAIAGPAHLAETSGVFEAAALGGVALMVASVRSKRTDA